MHIVISEHCIFFTFPATLFNFILASNTLSMNKTEGKNVVIPYRDLPTPARVTLSNTTKLLIIIYCVLICLYVDFLWFLVISGNFPWFLSIKKLLIRFLHKSSKKKSCSKTFQKLENVNISVSLYRKSQSVQQRIQKWTVRMILNELF